MEKYTEEELKAIRDCTPLTIGNNRGSSTPFFSKGEASAMAKKMNQLRFRR